MIKSESPSTWMKVYPYLLVIGAIIGLLAAGILVNDEMKLLQNSSFKPNCNLNPIFSCTSVMKSDQAKAFGFPNPIIGLASFGIVLTAGMAILAGARFKRWFWLGLQAGTVFGLLFIHWLFFESVYRIGALCIYCMIVWTVTIAIFWYTLLYNLRQGHIRAPASLKKITDFAQTNHLGILFIWYVVIAVLIIHRFWYFFGPH